MIRYSYDPEDVVTQRIGKHVHGQWRALSEMVVIGLMLGVLYVVSRIALGFFDEFFTALNPRLMTIVSIIMWLGITLGLIGAYLVVIFVSKYRDLRAERDTEEGYHAGPITVEIGPDGVSLAAPARTEHVRWSGVGNVVQTPLGLGLPLGDKGFVPVDAKLLPDGMSQADAKQAIEGWQAGAS